MLRIFHLLIMMNLLSACAAPSQQSVVIRQQVNMLAKLPAELAETSALALHKGGLWTLNDSGGKPSIYRLTADFKLVDKRLTLTKASNTDWEDMAQDEQYLYVADCGNNSGGRTDMAIYKVAWQDIETADNLEMVEASKLQFTFLDALDADINSLTNNYDCEALAAVGNELWVFSKNRGDLDTRLYRLDKSQPQQFVEPADSFPVNGLITAADYNPETQQIALLGCQWNLLFGHVFVWVVEVTGDSLNWQTARYYQIGPYGQWEAIVWKDAQTLLLSAENTPISNNVVAELKL